MSEQYLFLDIDGVLNTDPWLRKHGSLSLSDLMPEKVRLLADWLHHRQSVRVVLSSAWRHFWSLTEIEDALRVQDSRFPCLWGETHGLFDKGRDLEVLSFLRGRTLKNPDVRAVVLDDWPFRDCPLVDPLLIQTDPEHGLTAERLLAASQKLLTPVSAQGIDWERFKDRMGK